MRPPSRLLPDTLLSAHYFHFADRESEWALARPSAVKSQNEGERQSQGCRDAGLPTGLKGQRQRLLFLWVGDPHPCLSPHPPFAAFEGGAPRTPGRMRTCHGRETSFQNRAPGELGSRLSPTASCLHPHLPGCAARPRAGEHAGSGGRSRVRGTPSLQPECQHPHPASWRSPMPAIWREEAGPGAPGQEKRVAGASREPAAPCV